MGSHIITHLQIIYPGVSQLDKGNIQKLMEIL
jgi:hypothetical protein